MSFLAKSALKQFPQLLISQVQLWKEREYNSKKKKKRKRQFLEAKAGVIFHLSNGKQSDITLSFLCGDEAHLAYLKPVHLEKQCLGYCNRTGKTKIEGKGGLLREKSISIFILKETLDEMFQNCLQKLPQPKKNIGYLNRISQQMKWRSWGDCLKCYQANFSCPK